MTDPETFEPGHESRPPENATEPAEANETLRRPGAFLEQLYLIAQFYARDTDEAARLVDRVYRDLPDAEASKNTTLSALVERLVAHCRAGSVVYPAQELDASGARAQVAARYLDDRCRMEFLALSPDERLALWHSVESGSEPGMLVHTDALGDFVRRIEAVLSEKEQRVFGRLVSRSMVSSALRRYWETGFVPVPPTLRSVVDSSVRSVGDGKDLSSPRTPRERGTRRQSGLLRRLTTYAWVILAATAVGYLLTRFGEPAPPSTDVLQLSLSAADDVELAFRTDNAEQAERFIADRLGWRVTLPEIEEASLEGISLVDLVETVEVPVFVFYDNETAATIPVFTFSYAFLQTHGERMQLSRETLGQIQQRARFDVHQFRGRTAVVWRDRDDIFAAFVRGDQADFQSRIRIRS